MSGGGVGADERVDVRRRALRLECLIEIVRRGDYIEPRQDLGIGPQPRFSMKELAELQALFVTDIRRTEAITGLDLGRWKQLPDFPVDADAGGPGPKTSVSSKD